MDANAERQRTGGRDQAGLSVVLCRAGERQADRHTLRYVMQRYGEHEQRGAPERGGQPLGSDGTAVQMREQAVQREHEQNAEDKAAGGRDPADPASRLGLFNSGDQQAPNRSRDHDASRKAEENTLQQRARFAAQENTIAAPSEVIAKVKPVPAAAQTNACIIKRPPFRMEV